MFLGASKVAEYVAGELMNRLWRLPTKAKTDYAVL
jgi:hypothetical protein